jgi:hypothetical protein
MSQITIYLPEELEEQVRKLARSSGKSVSAYLADLARREVAPPRWPDDFAGLFGSWQGRFPEIEDAPPEDDHRL